VVGIWGAVIGTVGAYLCLAVYRMVDVKRYINFKIHYVQLALNGMIVILHAALISTDKCPAWESAVALALFIAVNFQDIKTLCGQMLRRIRKA